MKIVLYIAAILLGVANLYAQNRSEIGSDECKEIVQKTNRNGVRGTIKVMERPTSTITDFRYTYYYGFKPLNLNDTILAIAHRFIDDIDWFNPTIPFMDMIKIPKNGDISVFFHDAFRMGSPHKEKRHPLLNKYIYKWYVPSNNFIIKFHVWAPIMHFDYMPEETFSYPEEKTKISNATQGTDDKFTMQVRINNSKVISIEGICVHYRN